MPPPPSKREKIRPNLKCFVELGGATDRGFQLPGGFTNAGDTSSSNNLASESDADSAAGAVGGRSSSRTGRSSAQQGLRKYDRRIENLLSELKSMNGEDNYYLGESRSDFVRARSQDAPITRPRMHLEGPLAQTTIQLNDIVNKEADPETVPFPLRAEIINLYNKERRDEKAAVLQRIRYYAPTTINAVRKAGYLPKLNSPRLFPANHGM